MEEPSALEVHFDDVLAGDVVHVALGKTGQEVVIEQAHIGPPAALVGLHMRQVLLLDERSEGGDLFERSLLF